MLDVVVLFFLLGLLSGLARSELKLPTALYDSLSLVLLLAIGLKGGEGLAKQPLLPLLPQLGAVIGLGIVLTPLLTPYCGDVSPCQMRRRWQHTTAR